MVQETRTSRRGLGEGKEMEEAEGRGDLEERDKLLRGLVVATEIVEDAAADIANVKNVSWWHEGERERERERDLKGLERRRRRFYRGLL